MLHKEVKREAGKGVLTGELFGSVDKGSGEVGNRQEVESKAFSEVPKLQ
jgi:hypothetical protein